MKLDTPDGKFAMFNPHNLALLSFGGDFKAVRKSITLDDQRVVTCGREGIGHAREQILTVMFYSGSFSMHHAVVHYNVATEHVADALVAKANTECRSSIAESPDDFI